MAKLFLQRYRRMPLAIRKTLHSCILYSMASLFVGLYFVALPFNTKLILREGALSISSNSIAYCAFAVFTISFISGTLLMLGKPFALAMLLVQSIGLISTAVIGLVTYLIVFGIDSYPVTATILSIFALAVVVDGVLDMRRLRNPEMQKYLIDPSR